MTPPAFFQDPPRLANTFEADAALRDALARLLPPDLHHTLAPEWREMGAAAAGPPGAFDRADRRIPFFGETREPVDVHGTIGLALSDAGVLAPSSSPPSDPSPLDEAKLRDVALFLRYTVAP